MTTDQAKEMKDKMQVKEPVQTKKEKAESKLEPAPFPPAYTQLPSYFTNGIDVFKGDKNADTDLLVVKNELGMPLFRLILPRKVRTELIELFKE